MSNQGSVCSSGLTSTNLTTATKYTILHCHQCLTFVVRYYFQVRCCQRCCRSSCVCSSTYSGSVQEVRGDTSEQSSRPACSHRDNHTPCSRSLCSQVRHSCEVTPEPVMWQLLGSLSSLNLQKQTSLLYSEPHSYSCARHLEWKWNM